MRLAASCPKSTCTISTFWNLITLPAQTSYAAPHSQSTCSTNSSALWQKQHRASSNTLLRTRLSFVGNILLHALRAEILTLFGTLAFQIYDHKEIFDLCTEASPQLLSANLKCLATWYPNLTLYLPFFVKDQAKTSCTTHLLKGTWRIASASYGWNKARIQSLSH